MYPVGSECVHRSDIPVLAETFDVDFNMDSDQTFHSNFGLQLDVPVTPHRHIHRQIPLTQIDGLSEYLQALSGTVTDESTMQETNSASFPLSDSPTIPQNPDVRITRKHRRDRHAPLTSSEGLSEYMQAMMPLKESVKGAGIPRRDYGNPSPETALGSHAPTAEEIAWTKRLEARMQMRRARAVKAALNVENAIVVSGKRGLGSKDMRMSLGANVHAITESGRAAAGTTLMARAVRAGIWGMFSRR